MPSVIVDVLSCVLQIDVGAGGNFVLRPANVTASNGTLITFFFPR